MVIIFGTVCLDRVRKVERLPEKGGYAEIVDEVDLLGGEAANSALAIQKWKGSVRLSGNPIGHGANAELIRRMLKENEVDDGLVPAGEFETPFCDIYVTPDGDRTMFGRGFREMESRADPTLAPYAAGQWFSADPNPGDASRRAVRLAVDSAMKTYLLDFVREGDPILSGEGVAFWQSSTDWAGVRSNTQKNIQWVSRWLEKHGCFTILSDGPNGFVAGGPDRPVRAYPPYPCPDLVDSTGAGDIFRAGMLFGLDQNWPISDCLRYASAAGCLNCLGMGATSMIPSREEIESHIRENPSVSGQYE